MVDETLQAAINAGAQGSSYASGIIAAQSGSSTESRAAYDARIKSMTAPGSPYAGLNFMTYDQKYNISPGGTSGSGTAKPPGSVPSSNLAKPAINPASSGGDPAAAGYDMWQGMMDNVLNTERLRQSAIDQQVNVARLISELERVSPTRAADLSVALGVPGLEPNLGFANAFTNEGTSGVFGGKVGTQNIKLPFAFSGKELSFLGNNPNTQNILADIGDRFGRPDLIKNSISSAIPTSSSILGTF